MKVKVYVGKPMEEQFLKEISIGNGEYTKELLEAYKD